jgi:Holliday junction resolvase RusA-like endonuclease
MAVDVGTIAFTVLGRPQQKGSKRALPIRGKPKVGQQHIVLVDSNRNLPSWERNARSCAADAMSGSPHDGRLIRGGVVVELQFYFARPRSHYGIGRNADLVRRSAPRDMVSMPDVDKLARAALDALIGVVLHDDALVCELYAAKRYGEPERTEIQVHELRLQS